MGCAAPLGATATAHETRKTVTALFCDLVGSTTLGEQHDPEVLRGVLERYFDLVRAIVERHGGRVEKYVGDAVNGVFGLPAVHEDDALRAVRAGMEIQAGLADLAATSAVPLAARVGIHTGEVLAPGTGRPLIGDAMNTAARLQSGAEPGSVIIGEPTFRLVRDAVVAEPLQAVALKGKAAPVVAYVVRQVASLSPMRTRRLDAPMVGRTRESALLAYAFERAATDHACQLFTVLGSAGAGKSRLVEEFLGANEGADADVLRGRCLAYGDGITWYPVTEALRGALGLPEFAEVEEVRAAISEAVAGEEHAAALESNLASLFAAGSAGSPEEATWAIRRFLESRGRDRPVVLVLDDIHWGEPAFLDLVEHLADWSRDASILLLCMARPDLLDVRPTWGGGKTNATTISLAPLTPAETDALIDGLLGSSALPLEIRSRIAQVAEGNPLFVEEMLRMLVDDGRLVRHGAGWVAADDLVDVTVPPTVSALLSARLDRLSDGERAVVEAASVAGKEFHRGAVAALLPEAARADLAVNLRSLVRKELVTPERSSIPGEDAYRFRHLLIRDAAYDAIPKSARSEFHRVFADWLEGVAGDRVAEQQEIVGYHLERAYRYREELRLPEDRELRLRAGRALGAAGARALHAGNLRAAVDLLTPSADLVQGDRSALRILCDRASALFEIGAREDSATVVAQLAAAAASVGDPVFTMQARLLAFAPAYFDRPDTYTLEFVEALADEALRTYRANQARSFEPQALQWLGNCAWFRGDAATLIARASEGLETAAAIENGIGASANLGNLMNGLHFGPAPLSVALERADELLARFAGVRWIEAQLHADRAFLFAFLGRPDAAAAASATGLAITADMGSNFLWHLAHWVNADVARWQGRLETAVASWLELCTSLQAIDDRVNPGFIAPDLARVLIELDRDEEVWGVLQMLEHCPSGDSIFAAESLSIRSLLEARRGRIPEALRCSDNALAMVSPMDFRLLQGNVALDRAEVLRLAGRPEDARASAEDALERFERKEYAVGIRRARAFLEALPG